LKKGEALPINATRIGPQPARLGQVAGKVVLPKEPEKPWRNGFPRPLTENLGGVREGLAMRTRPTLVAIGAAGRGVLRAGRSGNRQASR
jgi:hypothetical protein